MNTAKPVLSQIKATAQLAEMAYNADPTEHKKAAWDKALSDYEQAAEAERVESEDDQVTLTVDTTNFIQAIGRLEEAKRDLEYKKHSLEQEVTFLKSQLIEKDQKISELEKTVDSAKSTEPEVAAAKKNS